MATKTIKLSRDKSVGHLSYWPINVEDFFNVKFALANYSIVYCSDEGLMLKCQPLTQPLTHYSGQFYVFNSFFKR